MDKYIEMLAEMPVDILHLSKSFATDHKSPQIDAPHLLRALLHKSAGLLNFIENVLDADYYYLLDWADIRISQCLKSAYPMKEPTLTYEARSIVKEAKNISETLGLDTITPEVLLATLSMPGVGFTAEQLKTFPLTHDNIMRHISGASASSAQSAKSPAIGITDTNVNQNAYLEYLLEKEDDIQYLGFDRQLRKMIEVLYRKDHSNLMILGENGVGKTALIHALVQKIRNGEVGSSLKGAFPVELDLTSITQGVSYKGEVEDRLRAITQELSQHPQPLLIIENFNRIEDKQSLLNGLLPGIKQLLSKNKVQLICTSNTDGFTKDIERDKELMSFFEKITIDEPQEELAREIILSKMPHYSMFHDINIESGLENDLVRFAKRYLPEKHLPSSAIDLLDRALAAQKVAIEFEESSDQAKPMLSSAFLKDVVANMTGIPMGNIQSDERKKLEKGEEILNRRVVGQNHAKKSILAAIYESRSGLNKKGQPVGSFFFLGPTGTGKTELSKSLAEYLFNDESAILRFDMSEYKEEHSVALLYGAPPGYVGYEEGGLLVNKIRQHPYSVVLFDEIEKAHKSVFDLFLQILDEGKLHDRLGRVGDFSNALIIFTSNIGSDYIFKSFENQQIPTHDQMLDVMQGSFRPEFLARLTEIIPFSPITTEMISKIFDIHIKNLKKSLDEQKIKLEIDDTARKYITKVGFNTHYGARPVLGIIRKEIRRPLSRLIISGNLMPGYTVTMKYNEESQEMVWEIDSPE